MNVTRSLLLTLTLASSLALTGCGSSSSQTVADPKFDKAGVDATPAKLADEYIKVNDNRQIKNEPSKKIFISAFRVTFLTNTSASATAYGGLDGDRKPVTAKVKMGITGLDNTQLQRLTDELYTLYVNDLKGLGYDVLTPEALASTDYKILKSESKASPQTLEVAKNKYLVFSPGAVPLTLLPGEGGFFSGFSALDSDNRLQVVPRVIKQSGASAVDVNITVNFAKGEASGGFFSNKADASLRPALHIVPGSGMSFTSHKEVSDTSVRMGHTIPPSTNIYVAKPIDDPGQFGKLVDNSSFFDSLFDSSTKSAVEVNMAQFRPMTQDLLDATRKMLIAKTNAARQ
jgi:hypothetical protein